MGKTAVQRVPWVSKPLALPKFQQKRHREIRGAFFVEILPRHSAKHEAGHAPPKL